MNKNARFGFDVPVLNDAYISIINLFWFCVGVFVRIFMKFVFQLLHFCPHLQQDLFFILGVVIVMQIVFLDHKVELVKNNSRPKGKPISDPAMLA